MTSKTPARLWFLCMLIFGSVNGLSHVLANESYAAVKTAAVDTIYVSPAGSNITGTGTKSLPWRSITFALSKITSDSLNPKVIKLANGVYSAAATSESFPLNLKSWISFAGSDSLNTIIDANRAARTLVGRSVGNLLINRLMIRNGFAKADTGEASRGGGIFLRNCRQLTVRSCVLRSNEAKTSGGGVFMGGGSNIVLENNFLDNNRAFDGAGIYCNLSKSAKISANTIQFNTATNGAGGIYIDFADPVIQRNRIRWNNASPTIEKNAGGIIVRSSSTVIGGSLSTGNDIHDNLGGLFGAQLFVIENAVPVNARYNYWGLTPTSNLVAPASLVDLSNYRNLAINIPLGSTDFYVDPKGSDQNHGAKSTPWRTMSFAFTQIFATSIDSLTILLAPGTYATTTNGEKFPIQAKGYITVLGSTSNAGLQSIISGVGVTNSELLRLENVDGLRLANIIFRQYKTNLSSSAILARFCEALTIDNCIFEDNQSPRGPALALVKVKTTELRNNIFRRNQSTGSGGALMLLQDNSTLLDNTFTDNTAASGGAVHCDSTSETRFFGNVFQNNAADLGGALYITLSNPRLYNNRFFMNRATVSGGAIALDGASLPQLGTRDSQANDIYLNTAAQSGAQIKRLDPGIKVDARYNYWGQIPDSTMISPFGQFSTENYRQVSERMPPNTKEIFVAPAGDDAASGVSRQQALRTIGEALRLVFGVDKNPITVRLLPGRFAAATNKESFPILLESYVNLRGVSRDSTTIDGENHSRVLEGRDLVNSVVSDLKITGGKASDNGGGILVRDGIMAALRKTVAATFENCLLQNNSANYGGALAAVRNYKTVMRNCILLGNLAQQNGGAVLALGDSVEIRDSEMYLNRATQDGGAANSDSAGILTLLNNRIYSNTAERGGAIAITDGLGQIWRNVIIDNIAQTGAAGGIYISANGKAMIGGALSNGNDIYGNRTATASGKALASVARPDKIDARYNFFGGKPEGFFADPPGAFDVSSFRSVTISVPEKSREFYLSPKGHDSNSGADKNSPWKTVASTLRKFFTEPGDSVRLHLLNGTYSEKSNSERLPLWLPSRVTLIGQHPDSTILDGENKARVLFIFNANRVNVRNLSIINGNDAATSSPPPAFVSAGGVHVHKSVSVRFEQVVFRGNKTSSNGGAIAADSSGQVNIVKCRFTDNQGLGGGVVFIRTSGEINGNEFRQNRSPQNGSAIFLNNSSPKITSNLIFGNIASATDIGGAIFCAGTSFPTIGGNAGQGNDIYNNTGGLRGIEMARQASAPVINATFNYFGNNNPTETQLYPLNGFDLNFSRKVPITANGIPVVSQVTPSTSQPIRAARQDTVRFQVAAYDPDNDLLTYTWTLDDSAIPVSYGPNYVFYPFFTGLGEHRIHVVVSDQRDTTSVTWRVNISTTSVQEQKNGLPKTFALQQNFPNPLRSAEAMTVIPFQIPKQTEVTLAIYDLLGRRVRLLEQSMKPAGFHQIMWNGLDEKGIRVENGIYFVRMQAGSFVAKQKIVVTR